MIAAIYARKSTEQRGVTDEQKSVARQIEHARAFAAARGWTVDERFVFADDGISGAEFANRPGLQQLLAAAGVARAPFQVLVVSEPSRLGREQLETGFMLKRLDVAGVRCWSYLSGEPILLDDPTKVLLMTLANFAADSERDNARKRVLDAMGRKAKAGHVIGKVPFGYERVEVRAGDQRSHVGRRIVPAHAAIVRRIFTEAAAGTGKGRIAKALIADGIPSPNGRLWAASTVAHILANEMYRGEIISHRFSHRDRWGQKAYAQRPASEWIRVRSEADRIVSEALWNAAKTAAAAKLAVVTRRGARPVGVRKRDDASRYMLTNFARCGSCGASICVAAKPRGIGGGKVRVYICLNYQLHGRARCANATTVEVERMNAAILDALRGVLADREAAIIELVVAAVLEKERLATGKAAAPKVRAALAKVEKELGRLAEALARGGLPSLYEKLADRERTAAALRAELAALERPSAQPRLSVPVVRKRVRAFFAGAREDLDGGMDRVRKILRGMLDGPIVFAPAPGVVPMTRQARNQFGPRRDVRAFSFTGKLDLLPAFGGVAAGADALPISDLSRTGSGKHWKPAFTGIAA